MGNRKNVVKIRRRKDINIGIVIFLILFLYISINIYIYFTKDHISIYEVNIGSNVEDSIITGVCIRDEEVILSENAGYITYYVKDGERVAKNTNIYSVDDTRKVYDYMMSQENPIKLTKKNNSELRQTIKKLYQNYSDSKFSDAFEYQEIFENTLSEIISNTIIDNSISIGAETGLASNITIKRANKSGLITYYYDGYESLDEKAVNASLFEAAGIYKKTNLRTVDMIGINAPVYRQINNDNWSIIFPLSNEQYTELSQKTKLTFTISKDNFTITAPFSVYQNGTSNYAKITLDKYVQRYCDERFLEIDLKLHKAEGLKIPITSIVEKEFYLVPLEYFTIGSDSDRKGVVVETYVEGIPSYSFKETEIYYQNEEYGYVDASLFTLGTKLHSPSTNETFTISQMATLTGVYNINKGYAVFRRIEILYENNEYCIVRKDTKNGLSNYDHIALDASCAVEDAVIY